MDSKGLRNVGFSKFFSDDEILSEEEQAKLAEAAEHVVFRPGEVLIEEGVKVSTPFVLISGRVEVRKRVSNHSDRLLAMLSASNENAFIGERGLLSDREASATVRALEKVEAVKITRDKFQAMIADGQTAAYKLAYRIAHILAERVADTNESIAKIAAQLEDAESDRGIRDIDIFRDKLVREWSL